MKPACRGNGNWMNRRGIGRTLDGGIASAGNGGRSERVIDAVGEDSSRTLMTAMQAKARKTRNGKLGPYPVERRSWYSSCLTKG